MSEVLAIGGPDGPGCAQVSYQLFRSEPQEVRAALADVVGGLRPLDVDDDTAHSVELVLAEVLNNICEHAYGGDRGMIEVTVALGGEAIWCEVVDSGAPMPGHRPPEGLAPDPAGELPEGGFGWFLIRALTGRLDYLRSNGRNRLSFSVPLPDQSSSS